MPEPADWSKWDEERWKFKARDTEGFTKDLEALGDHIKILRAVSPKDEAGVPVVRALTFLGKMTKDYNTFTEYLILNQ